MTKDTILARASESIFTERHLNLLLLGHLQKHRLANHHRYCSEYFSDNNRLSS
jgi:hypothetical protein